jgi:hypothetical protein
MKSLFKYLDPLQIIGFSLSAGICIYLISIKQDTTLSLLIGLSLGIVTQLFDLQVRMMASTDKLENTVVDSIQRVIRSLHGVDIRPFNDEQELYEYIIKRMREAKKTIDDITIGTGERERTPFAQKAFERYIETIAIICTKGRIAYREVMCFPPLDHFDRAEAILRKNLFGYRIKYYTYTNHEEIPPILKFMVIDSEEIIIAFYRSALLPKEREIRLAIRHPDVVKLFQDYYDTLWHGARFLKDGNKPEIMVLQDLRERIRQQKTRAV